jgi:hypothetical protein
MQATRKIPLTRGLVAIVDEADYDLVMAHQRWKADRHGRTYYAVVNLWSGGECVGAVRMHRLILPGAEMVDHINGDGLDNRRCNLRVATNMQNQWNAGRRADNSSGYKGVSLRRATGKWYAYIRVNGFQHSLGFHDTAEHAARARDAAALEMHGEFARLNFPTA